MESLFGLFCVLSYCQSNLVYFIEPFWSDGEKSTKFDLKFSHYFFMGIFWSWIYYLLLFFNAWHDMTWQETICFLNFSWKSFLSIRLITRLSQESFRMIFCMIKIKYHLMNTKIIKLFCWPLWCSRIGILCRHDTFFHVFNFGYSLTCLFIVFFTLQVSIEASDC